MNMKNQKITVAEYKMPLIPYRHFLKRKAKSVIIIKRNDQRIRQTHYCNACGKLLSGYIGKNRYRVYNSYYKLIIDKQEIYYICYNDKVCLKNQLKRKNTDMLTLYKVV